MKLLLALVFSLPGFMLIAFLLFYSAIEYRPKEINTLNKYNPETSGTKTSGTMENKTPNTSTISIMTWNIGYGGMGKNMDYYFDGGKRVNPTETEFNYNYKGILSFIEKNKVDVNLFQEVDIKSQRSYFNDMGEGIMNLLGGSNYFSANYKNPYVPFPLKSPIGKVHGGLFTSSRFTPDLVQQIPLPSENEWPKKLFNLKRNILEMRINYKGKELIIANVHNSAFDKGDIRNKQLKFIADRYLSEYAKGNYVILGGDFNMLFPGTALRGAYPKTTMININDALFPGDWIFSTDTETPTNRDASISYNPLTTGLSNIDGFLLSPNIEVLETKVHDLAFEFSDHQPVIIKVVLK